jgi:hypothetical protein
MALLLLSVVAVLVSCGGGGGGLGGTGGSGGGGGGGGGIGGTGAILRVTLTDAPACGFDNVYVTVASVRVNANDTDDDGDSGWQTLPLNPPRQIDLLTLRNGATTVLGEQEVPAGRYRRLRLVLAENGVNGASALANSVVPTATGVQVPLETPSAQQSGLKVRIDAEVRSAALTEIRLDFDACQSVVSAGNSGRFNLRPQITATVLP